MPRQSMVTYHETYVVPAPGRVERGEEVGPCVDPACGHSSCIMARRLAARRCVLCDSQIGYDVPFTYTWEFGGTDVMHLHKVCPSC